LQQNFKRKVKLKSERMSWYFIYSTALTGAAALYVGCLVIVDLYRNYKKKKDTKVEEFKLEQVEETPMTVSESGDGFVVDSGYNGGSSDANGGSSDNHNGGNRGYNDGSSNNQNGRNSSDNTRNNYTTQKQTQPMPSDEQKKGYNDNASQQNQQNQQNQPAQSGDESYGQSQQYTSNDKTDDANQSPAPSKAKEKIERINRELVEGDTVSELSCSPSEFAELLMGRGASGLISKPRILIEHNEC
jgi:FtsZ-interacting cell division protein ZipA